VRSADTGPALRPLSAVRGFPGDGGRPAAHTVWTPGGSLPR